MSTVKSRQPPPPGEDAAVPALFRGLVDDAAVFPPGSAPLAEALHGHAGHRTAWYADLVGPLLLPYSMLPRLTGTRPPRLGVVCDTGLAGVPAALAAADGSWSQLEVAVARRGEDPLPGVTALVAAAAERPGLDLYAEVPLAAGLLAALDRLAAARAGGVRIAPKFRTGGLAAELFPTPTELAAVICACRDRDLPFKLTAGLHHAVRHTDGGTGFVHHGFLNVLAACLAAVAGADPAEVAAVLASTDPVALVERTRAGRERPRPLWVGFGSCSVAEPLADLTAVGLLSGGSR